MEVAHVFEHYIVSSPYGIALDAVVVCSWVFYFLIHNLSGHAVINFKEQDIMPEVILNILIIWLINHSKANSNSFVDIDLSLMTMTFIPPSTQIAKNH